MITEYLDKNNLIVAPNYLKAKIIREINDSDRLISFKVISIEEFMNSYFFSYDKKTIYYLINKLGIKYDIAIEYLKSLYYLNKNNYSSSKLNELVILNEELTKLDLLKTNPYFSYYLNNTSVIVFGYDYLDPFYMNIFNELPSFKHVKTENQVIQKQVYAFNDIEEEIAFICEDIKKKLDSGISIDNIKIINPSSEYVNPLNRIFSWCNLPIELNNKIKLITINAGQKLLKLIHENKTFTDIVEAFDGDIKTQIISILNDYVDWNIDSSNLYEMIKYDLENTYLPQKKKINCIHVLNNIEELSNDDYGYILGFNKENYPIIYKDEDFLSDNMKKELSLFDSNDNNINSINKLKNSLNSTSNLVITYKLKTAFNSYNPCLLINDREYEVIRNPILNYNISHLFNKITLARECDNYYKYGIYSDNLVKLISNYQDLPYRTYDNKFKSLDNTRLLNYIRKPFTLSYSSIGNYYRCGFRYYINNILRIKEENIDEFYMNIGNIFHYVLSQCFNPSFDFDTSWNSEASKYNFTFDKLILLEKLKDELKYDINIINKHKSNSCFDSYLYEKEFSIPIPNTKNIPIQFVGIIDKISFLKDTNKTLVSIIDYKTGTLHTNLNNIIYGIGMQLPIYLYFIKRSTLFPNLQIVGFYLQKIINKDMKAVGGKTFDELKENALKLVGYSTDNEMFLEKFDITYQDSTMISGLKKKKDGFYAYSKVLNDEQIDSIDKLVSDNINRATNMILEGDFSINPKKIGKDKVGCEFCSYRDICYRTENDYIELEKHQNLDFLGGE